MDLGKFCEAARTVTAAGLKTIAIQIIFWTNLTVQAIARTLRRYRADNLRWREDDIFMLGENRWRAQRYGTTRGLIDFG